MLFRSGVLSSAIAAFFYIRVIVAMYFTDAHDDTVSVIIPSRLTSLTIWCAGLVTLILGVYPTPLITQIEKIATFIH